MIKYPPIFDKAKLLFEELESLGYAVRLPAYTSRGRYIYDEYIACRK
jgi:hypothetical protein